jgi:hypothetical protein
VQITMAENFGIQGRGAFYDATGTIRDVVQNHLFQVLANLAVKAPAPAPFAPLPEPRPRLDVAVPEDPEVRRASQASPARLGAPVVGPAYLPEFTPPQR